ncbi:MAG: trypsin-like peptidase domain-containing protein [Actinomycetota bacterium]|nr:trypsin-like peptidase domain-containing protein [Actinomycetota bacterium]
MGEWESSGRRWRSAFAVTILFVALVGGFAGGVIAYALGPAWNARGTATPATGGNAPCSVTAIATKDLPSVVTVSATGTASASGEVVGDTGSGEVIRSNGYIVTNNHVVSIAADGGSVQVRFNDGAIAPAIIIGRDPLTDLAVLKVSVARPLSNIALGSSGTVEIGEPVVVLGSPLGLSSTVTSGIISALDRTISVPGENGKSAVLINALQTDAAINPGNSGGALVDCSGSLIGIPSAGATIPNESGQASGGSIGLGFAIPVDVMAPIVNQIIETGRVTHADLGLTAEPVPSDSSVQAGTSTGILVTYVDPNGPASRAGLLVGDIMTMLSGKPAISTDQLVAIALTHAPGTNVSVTYLRDGRQFSTVIVLGAQQ